MRFSGLLIEPIISSDAKRPCSTCVRSHAHAVAHAPAGTQLPPHPDCTFDDGEHYSYTNITIDLTKWLLLVAESPSIIAEGPKNRYERLENRISQSDNTLWLPTDINHLIIQTS